MGYVDKIDVYKKYISMKWICLVCYMNVEYYENEFNS